MSLRSRRPAWPEDQAPSRFRKKRWACTPPPRPHPHPPGPKQFLLSCPHLLRFGLHKWPCLSSEQVGPLSSLLPRPCRWVELGRGGWQVLATRGRPPAARDHRGAGRVQGTSAPTPGSLDRVFLGLDLGPEPTEEAASSPPASGSSAEAWCCPHRRARQEAHSVGHGHSPLEECVHRHQSAHPEDRCSRGSQPLCKSTPLLVVHPWSGPAIPLSSGPGPQQRRGPGNMSRSSSSLSSPFRDEGDRVASFWRAAAGHVLHTAQK